MAWDKSQQARICIADMSYMRRACGVTRRDGKNREKACNKKGW